MIINRATLCSLWEPGAQNSIWPKAFKGLEPAGERVERGDVGQLRLFFFLGGPLTVGGPKRPLILCIGRARSVSTVYLDCVSLLCISTAYLYCVYLLRIFTVNPLCSMSRKQTENTVVVIRALLYHKYICFHPNGPGCVCLCVCVCVCVCVPSCRSRNNQLKMTKCVIMLGFCTHSVNN